MEVTGKIRYRAQAFTRKLILQVQMKYAMYEGSASISYQWVDAKVEYLATLNKLENERNG